MSLISCGANDKDFSRLGDQLTGAGPKSTLPHVAQLSMSSHTAFWKSGNRAPNPAYLQACIATRSSQCCLKLSATSNKSSDLPAPAHPPFLPLLTQNKPKLKLHLSRSHHGKLAQPPKPLHLDPSLSSHIHPPGTDVDRNGLRSRQLHLLTRWPKFPSRVCSQGSRERRYIHRYPMQRWRCSGGGEGHHIEAAEARSQQENRYH